MNFKYKWEQHPKKRLWFGAFGSLVLTLTTFGVLRFLVQFYYTGNSVAEFIAAESIDSYVVALVITLIASLFTHAFYFYRALQKREVKQQKIIAGTASARFDALKNQLQKDKEYALTFIENNHD